MSLTWLCLENTSKIVLFLIALTVLSLKATNATNTNRQTGGDTHVNTLQDDIEHEEFIDADSQQPHSRRKRLVWITDDGRLALPPGTALTFTPTIALPLVRHPPEGFFSNMSISFPVTIDFDKLGLTDNQNPLGDLPPIFSRTFSHTAGEMLGNYMSKYLHFRRRRDLSSQQQDQQQQHQQQQHQQQQQRNPHFNINVEKKHVSGEHQPDFPQLPERFKHIFHGGERVILYGVVEDFLSTFGMNGKACLLRTICEVHSRKTDHYGVFGEMAKLFLTVTRSPFSDLIPEYVKAQEIGEGRTAPGECFPYHKECPRSLFKALQNHKYKESQKGEYHEQEVEVITEAQVAENPSAAEILDQQIISETENPQENEIQLDFKKTKKLYSM